MFYNPKVFFKEKTHYNRSQTDLFVHTDYLSPQKMLVDILRMCIAYKDVSIK